MKTEQAIPKKQYAEYDGLSIAYKVFGSGSQDLIIIPGTISHVEGDWERPSLAQVRWQLSQFFLFIVFNKLCQFISYSF